MYTKQQFFCAHKNILLNPLPSTPISPRFFRVRSSSDAAAPPAAIAITPFRLDRKHGIEAGHRRAPGSEGETRLSLATAESNTIYSSDRIHERGIIFLHERWHQ
jgi:hypothetical protein